MNDLINEIISKYIKNSNNKEEEILKYILLQIFGTTELTEKQKLDLSVSYGNDTTFFYYKFGTEMQKLILKRKIINPELSFDDNKTIAMSKIEFSSEYDLSLFQS